MAKPEVIVNSTQLRNAFKSHLKAYSRDENNASLQLLLFYAVETGLKAKFLIERNHRDTSDFEKEFGSQMKYGHGHKITRWVADLKIAASVVSFSDDPNDPVENVHEKLRYGSSLQSARGQSQVVYLRSIATHLKKIL
jgi:hypothetical protein